MSMLFAHVSTKSMVVNESHILTLTLAFHNKCCYFGGGIFASVFAEDENNRDEHRESRLVRAVGNRSHVLSELSNSCKLQHLNKELHSHDSINDPQFEEDEALGPILLNPQHSFEERHFNDRDFTTDDILANMGSEDFEA